MWAKGYALVLLATCAFWFAVNSFLVVLPISLLQRGLDAGAIGLVFGVGAPASIVGRLISGRLIDRIGARLFLLIGAGAWALTPLALILAPNLSVLIALRLVQGLALGAFTNAGLVAVFGAVAEEWRDRAVGWWVSATPAMSAFAPTVAALIVQQFGVSLGFVLSASAGVVAVLAGAFLPGSPSERVQLPTEPPPPKQGRAAKSYVSAALLPGFLGGTVAFASGAFGAFAPVLAAAHHQPNLGAYLTATSVGAILVRFVADPLAERKGIRWTILPGFALATGAMAVIGSIGNGALVLVPSFVFGLGTGALVPSILSWSLSRVYPSERARAGSTFYACYETGLLLGPPVAGVAFQRFGFPGFGLVAAVLAVGGITYAATQLLSTWRRGAHNCA